MEIPEDWDQEASEPVNRPVVVQQLFDIINQADELVVKETPFADAKVLYSTRQRADFDALAESIALHTPGETFHCMCSGSPLIYIYREGEEIGLLGNHHGVSLRFSHWTSDVLLKDSERWLTWFDQRGLDGPRQEVEQSRQRALQTMQSRQRWQAAMPAAIVPVWDEADGFFPIDVLPLQQTLNKAISDPHQRILALLNWFGSGEGPWSGYPSYEGAAEEMLLQYASAELLAAINSTSLSEAQVEGAARLFGGWSFSKQRPDDLTLLPDEMKERFWEHVKGCGDKDKLSRARRAFCK